MKRRRATAQHPPAEQILETEEQLQRSQNGVPGAAFSIMKRVIDSSEALGTLETSQGAREVCVTAHAGFDEKTRELIVQLQSFLRPANLLENEHHSQAAWMLADSTVIEKVEPLVYANFSR